MPLGTVPMARLTRRAAPQGRSFCFHTPLRWLFALSLLLGLSGCSSSPDESEQKEEPVIAISRAVIQGDKLYAEARLSPSFRKTLKKMLSSGEPLTIRYQFRFVKHNDWLPNYVYAQTSTLRRMRYHLITERYEMQEDGQDNISYTPDADVALRFLANPRYVPLTEAEQLKGLKLIPVEESLEDSGLEDIGPVDYHLETRLEVHSEGLSKMFRVLFRMLTFWQPIEHFHHEAYKLQ
uniref:DUF4390 domain-containing protein n=1 Tax=Magnetococcus massalia (strain MO-1) TaxID=451514 RepID=A0A1S7LLN9_MAGMO|nr:conserved protein of unknown function [Candidatus Magnetococcus massalia]